MSPLTVRLREWEATDVGISDEDARYLVRQGLEVIPVRRAPGDSVDPITPKSEQNIFAVNPRQYVGHFRLPSQTIVSIRPKIPQTAVLRTLAYVYGGWADALFAYEDVLYEKQFGEPFEPLIKLFNHLVSKKIRQGLVKDYYRTQDNLRVLRGSVLFEAHVKRNVPARPDHIFCRYFENTLDTEDNQIIKWTLHVLNANSTCSEGTQRLLRANLGQLSGVTLKCPRRAAFENRTYHRLNIDYRPIHQLCQLFLEHVALSDDPGSIPFSGFRLDMNDLFERFVSAAFERVGRRVGVIVKLQHRSALSEDNEPQDYAVNIHPDIKVLSDERVIAIADAKYKKADNGFVNPDVYQALAYGTGLDCKHTYLVYPASEFPNCVDGDIRLRNSIVVVGIRRIDLAAHQFVNLMEDIVANIIECSASRSGETPSASRSSQVIPLGTLGVPQSL